MIPMRRLPDPPEERTHVLVPGLFGLGFLISLGVLAGDFVGRLLPASGKKRWAAMERQARGRRSDIAAVRSGHAPEPGVVDRIARGRLVSFGLATVAGLLAAASIVGGFAVAAHVGVDRQGWAIGSAFVVATTVSAFGFVWLMSGAFGRRGPRWLRHVNSFWPFGTYPDPRPTPGGMK